jgi:MFS family permease
MESVQDDPVNAKSTFRKAVLGLNRNLKLLLVVGVATALANGILAPVLAPYFLQLGLSGSEVGYLSSVMGVAAAASLVPAAYLADLKGRKPLALLAFIAGLPAVFLTALGSKTPLYIAFALLGFANTAAGVAINPLLADSVERKEQMDAIFSVFQIANLVSSSLGMLLSWPLLALSGVLGGVLAVYKTALLISAALFAVCLPVLAMVSETRRPSGRFELAVSKIALKLAGLQALLAFGAGLGVRIIGYWFASKYGVSAGELGLQGVAENLLIVAATASAPFLSSKLGTLRAVVALQLATVPLMVATALSPSFIAAAAFFTVRSALANASNPLVSSLQMRLAREEERARMSMLNVLTWQVAGAAGSALGGILLDAWIDLPLYAASAVYLVQAILFYYALGRVGERNASP